jgi:hypothetical protein
MIIAEHNEVRDVINNSNVNKCRFNRSEEIGNQWFETVSFVSFVLSIIWSSFETIKILFSIELLNRLMKWLMLVSLDMA